MNNQIVVLRNERKLIILNPVATPYIALNLDEVLSALADAGMRVVPVIPAAVPVPAKPAPAPAAVPVQIPLQRADRVLEPHVSNNPVIRLKNRYGLSTNVELAKQLDVSSSTVNNWHNGKAMPFSHSLDKLAALLDEPPASVEADFSMLHAAYLRKHGGA